MLHRIIATSRPVDWLIVASLLLLTWFEIWIEPIFQTGMPGPRLPLTLFAAAALTPLLARRAFPLAALIVMCVALLAVGVVGDPDQSTFVLLLGLLVATYSLAARAAAQNALIGTAVVLVATIVFQFLTSAEKTLIDVLVPAMFLAAAWIVGKELHRQRQRAGEAAEYSKLLARTHRLEMDAAIAAERTHIARELHDVVAHAISVMVIQAGAARRTLAPDQGAQHEALLAVESLGREALGEMQRMLGILRTEGADQGFVPLPDLSHVPALAADARSAGLDVTLDVAADLESLPPGLQLNAYRIVQEALTNVRKHSHGSAAHVTISDCGANLEITIADDGIGVKGEPPPGNGLIGMQERVAIHHGTLHVGPGETGGFLVRALLSLEIDR